MAIDTQNRKTATYFTGIEVENTAMKGEETLFVVGVQPVDEIRRRADVDNIKHLYFGTSQSFTPASTEEWDAWDNMITPLLAAGYWVTLDFGVEYADEIHEEGWCESNTFIAMISVKLPYIKLFNYNTTLKIDDTTWGHSNPGIWCHSLHDLQTRATFTGWNHYGDDTIIE